MADKNSIGFAGDVRLNKVVINTAAGIVQDITRQVLEIQVFEDIFTPFMTATIACKESFDIISLLPLIGEEFITISVTTPSDDEAFARDINMFIHSVDERVHLGDKSSAYVLHAISIEAIIDANKSVSRSYSGKCSEIAKDIFTDGEDGLESEKEIQVEPTSNSTKFISNYWSPVRNLSYITQCAMNTQGLPGYIFFENSEGFVFSSLQNLYNRPHYQTFIYDNYSRDRVNNATSSTIKNVEKEYQRINSYTPGPAFDYLRDVNAGMYSSKLITYDTTLKKYSTMNFNMLKDFQQQPHLNKGPLISSRRVTRPEAVVRSGIKHYSKFNSYSETSNLHTAQQRSSLLYQIRASTLDIEVFGRTDYTVGQTCLIEIYKSVPIHETDTTQDLLDKTLSGKYLISSINHHITKSKHECYMTLVKDSYLFDLEAGES